MKPETFKEVNMIMGAGNNPGTDDLPICKAEHPDIKNVPFLVSKWKMSPEELEKVKETGEIWIGIMGEGMPSICPMAFHPFNEHGYKQIDL